MGDLNENVIVSSTSIKNLMENGHSVISLFDPSRYTQVSLVPK